LPCVLILLDFWPLRRFSAEPRVSPVPAGMNSSVGPSPRPRFEWPGCLRRWFGFSPCASFLGVVLEKLPFFGLAALTSFLAVKAQQDLGALMSQTTLPLVERIANALVAYAAYLDKTVLPMNLSVHYNHPYVHPLWRIAIACLALAILSALAVRIRRNHPIVLFGWLWFLGVLIPSIGLVQAGSQSMADRYTYIPSFGLLLMLVPLLEIKSPQALRRMRIGTGGVALSAVALILAAEHQLQYWRNTQSLFERAIQVDPHDFIAHTNLGITYKRQGKFALAIASLQLAMIGNPTTGLPKLAMADLLARQGKPLASLPFYFSALHGRDNMRHFAHSELAFIFCQLGRVEEGIPHLYEALRIRPGFQTATALLAEIYAREKDPRFRDGRKAVALAHELCEATYGIVPEYLGLLAAAYAECGQFDKAVEGAQRAIVRAAISGKDRLKHHLEQELKLYREHKKPLHVLEQGRATDLTESANSGPPPGNTE